MINTTTRRANLFNQLWVKYEVTEQTTGMNEPIRLKFIAAFVELILSDVDAIMAKQDAPEPEPESGSYDTYLGRLAHE